MGTEASELQPVDLTMINFPLGNYTADEARLLQTLHPVFKIAAHPERPGNAILAGWYSIKKPLNPSCEFCLTWLDYSAGYPELRRPDLMEVSELHRLVGPTVC